MELLPYHINYISEPFFTCLLSESKKMQFKVALEALTLTGKAKNKKCCIAGGFAAYLLDRTIRYGDIDIYVENSAYPPYAMKTPTSNFFYKTENINEISIGKFVCNYENFVFNILKEFDMTVCKVGIYINERDELRIIKFPQNGVDLFVRTIRADRFIKYVSRLRDIYKPYNPKKLSLLAYIALCKNQPKIEYAYYK